jgi:hypothetical protein
MKQGLVFTLVLFNLFKMTAFSDNFRYDCFSYYWNGYEGESSRKMSLTVTNKTQATADILEETWDKNLGGNLDVNYRSRGKIKYLKFGYELLLEDALLVGGKKLRDGTLGGFARVEGTAEGGFYQYKFICKAL